MQTILSCSFDQIIFTAKWDQGKLEYRVGGKWMRMAACAYILKHLMKETLSNVRSQKQHRAEQVKEAEAAKKEEMQ